MTLSTLGMTPRPRTPFSLNPSLDLNARFARVGHAQREASHDEGLAGGSLSLLGKAQKTSRLLRPPYPPKFGNLQTERCSMLVSLSSSATTSSLAPWPLPLSPFFHRMQSPSRESFPRRPHEVLQRNRCCERVRFRAPKTDKNDRVLLKMRSVFLPRLRNMKPLEKMPEVLWTLLEKPPQHRQIERFAKPSRPWHFHDFDAASIEKLRDELRLVDVLETAFTKLTKVTNANRNVHAHGQ